MNISPEEIAYQEAHINSEKSTTVQATSGVFGIIALILVVARLWNSKRLPQSKIPLDDWLILVAMVATAVSIVAACMQARWGIGRHLITFTPADVVNNGKWEVVSGFSYVISITFISYSILAFYSRVFTLNKRWFKFAVWFMVVYNTLWFIALMLLLGLECRPFNSQWSLMGNCKPTYVSGYTTGIFNVLSNAALLALPQPHVWNLRMPWKRRFSLSLIFLVGTFAIILSIARIPLLRSASGAHPEDPTYYGYLALLFSVLECIFGVICACMPTIAKPLSQMWETTLARSTSVRSLFSKSSSRLSGPRRSSPSSKTSDTPNSHINVHTSIEVNSKTRNKTKEPEEYQLNHFPVKDSREASDNV